MQRTLAGITVAVTLVAITLAAIGGSSAASAEPSTGPIFFRLQSIDFILDNSETSRRHAPETMAGGVAVFDFDNDGNADIFFTNGADIRTLKKDAPKYWNRLFRGKGDGTFTDVTEKAGLQGSGYDTGVAIGDFDNDGHKDLFLAGVYRNTLYRNRGDGTFEDVTDKAGVSLPDNEFGPLWAVGAAWLDYDKDGRLDLFVVNYLSWDIDKEPLCEFEGAAEYCHPRLYKELPNRLFRNKGDGTFEDVSETAGIRAFPGKGMGAAVADFDQDGWPDVFVANDKLFNFLFRNLGNGKFREIAFESGSALPEHGNFISGMGVDARDLDNDGLPDIAFVALDNETFPLFRNLGKGRFREVTADSGLTLQSRSMAGYSPGIVDFDNDGWKDLFVSRGHVQSPSMAGRVQIDQHNTVFRNLGNGKMNALTKEAGFEAQAPSRHRGAAFGDFNRDGKIDIVVVALRAPAEVWINQSPGDHHWLMLDLVGTRSNRDAIGAEVKVVSARGTQYSHVTSAIGYASSSAYPLHFGLGPDAQATLVEIRWPSGKLQQMKNITSNQLLRIEEPAE
jgi:enediyne biosynthesis protein E4